MSTCTNNEKSFETTTAKCLEFFLADRETPPCAMAEAIMETSDIPMHNFVHHYLVPAVLLTAAGRLSGYSREEYEKKMAEVEKRAKNVLPAYCGFYGACGAAIGVGIFMSVYTGTTPLVKETWGICNMSTAVALTKMAEIGGPRCCKRNTFLALQEGAAFAAEHLGLDLKKEEKVECTFSHFNLECLKEDCLYYSEEEKKSS